MAPGRVSSPAMVPDDQGRDPIRMDLRNWGPWAGVITIVLVVGLFVILLLSAF